MIENWHQYIKKSRLEKLFYGDFYDIMVMVTPHTYNHGKCFCLRCSLAKKIYKHYYKLGNPIFMYYARCLSGAFYHKRLEKDFFIILDSRVVPQMFKYPERA